MHAAISALVYSMQYSIFPADFTDTSLQLFVGDISSSTEDKKYFYVELPCLYKFHIIF